MLDGDGIARFVWIALVLMMVLSALAARRIPLARLVTWSLAWVALFLGAYLLFAWIAPQFTAWQQSRRGGTVETSPDTPEVRGATVSIPMSEDGHYWVDAAVEGRRVRFLVDSGASITAMSQSAADALGLAPGIMGGSIVMQTANGPVTARRATIKAIEIGGIRARDLPVVISASFGEVNVLGMNFLGKLKSWRVEDGKMVLEAH